MRRLLSRLLPTGRRRHVACALSHIMDYGEQRRGHRPFAPWRPGPARPGIRLLAPVGADGTPRTAPRAPERVRRRVTGDELAPSPSYPSRDSISKKKRRRDATSSPVTGTRTLLLPVAWSGGAAFGTRGNAPSPPTVSRRRRLEATPLGRLATRTGPSPHAPRSQSRLMTTRAPINRIHNETRPRC